MYVCIYINMYEYVCMYLFFMYVCIYLCMYVCMYVRVYRFFLCMFANKFHNCTTTMDEIWTHCCNVYNAFSCRIWDLCITRFEIILYNSWDSFTNLNRSRHARFHYAIMCHNVFQETYGTYQRNMSHKYMYQRDVSHMYQKRHIAHIKETSIMCHIISKEPWHHLTIINGTIVK